jgi:hypothetical protein
MLKGCGLKARVTCESLLIGVDLDTYTLHPVVRSEESYRFRVLLW